MTYQSLEAVITDPMFPRADLDLRRGKHISADRDPSMHDFIIAAKPFLDAFYARYEASLVLRQEGYLYLLPDRNAVPPPLGQHKLSAMDMLAGQALALMRLDPRWLESSLHIPDMAVLQLLEQILGEERLLRFARRRRGRDVERDARKLRDSFAVSLRALERQGFIQRERRAGLATVVPLVAIMRFADPVRTSADMAAALEGLIAAGQIVDSDDEGEMEADT